MPRIKLLCEENITINHVSRKRILFQGSHSGKGRTSSRGRTDSEEQWRLAAPLAEEIGRSIIAHGFDLILTGAVTLDELVGVAATKMCDELGVNPRDRIRTYPHGREAGSDRGFGLVIEPLDRRWQEVRTNVIHESDAVIAVLGGKGTSDCVQKAVLARKPVFPVSIAGGGSQAEWERLKRAGYYNGSRGDIDFLADRSLEPRDMADTIAEHCKRLLDSSAQHFSRRVFIVHGHDDGPKNELARVLDRLEFSPVILHEQPDKGQSIFSKLTGELSDVGFAFILLTPDDVGNVKACQNELNSRARQNVVFEHGLLVGMLGAHRVCAIVKGDVEIPSDLHGVLYKTIPPGNGINAIALDLAKELRSAGYEVDANLI